MHKPTLHVLVVALATATGSVSTANTVIHQWTFADTANTLITGATNSGSVGGVSFTGGDPGWKTSGSGTLDMIYNSNTTVIQSLAALGTNVNFGVSGTRFEWDVKLNFSGTNTSGQTRDMYFINRNAGGGTNIFRFSIEIPNNSSTASIFAEGSLKARGAALGTVGLSDSITFRVDYKWNEANTTITNVDYGFAINGGSFVTSQLEAQTNSITNLGDLRLHAKGIYSSEQHFAMDAIRVTDLTVVPEPSAFAALAGLGALGFATARRRRQS